MVAIPILKDIVRQHAEGAAHLWTVYDWHLLNPDDNPDMDANRLAMLIERLDAHLDGLRIAGDAGVTLAKERYAEFPEAGELFVLRMIHPNAQGLRIADLDLQGVRDYLRSKLG